MPLDQLLPVPCIRFSQALACDPSHRPALGYEEKVLCGINRGDDAALSTDVATGIGQADSLAPRKLVKYLLSPIVGVRRFEMSGHDTEIQLLIAPHAPLPLTRTRYRMYGHDTNISHGTLSGRKPSLTLEA